MEANVCDVNHLDADVLLPPRKRLLAGLKKQNCDNECTSHASMFPSSSSSSPSSVFNTRLNSLLSSHTSNSDLSPEEIVEASRCAAEKAAAVAKAARAAAEEKAEIAARAVAAAKNALDLVASFSEEIGNSDSYLKKNNNKLKKHVPVNSLYKKYKSVENCKTDEELARTLHRAINSSPRISKYPSSSGSKAHKHKKPRVLSEQDKARVFGNGHSIGGEAGSEESSGEKNVVELGKKEAKYAKYDQLDMENGESSQLKEKLQEDVSTTGKKRGRVKLKKLPLSICTIKDIATPKDETPPSLAGEDRTGSGSKSLSTVDNSGENLPSLEAAPVWKCQEFQVPSCVKQNKVAQL